MAPKNIAIPTIHNGWYFYQFMLSEIVWLLGNLWIRLRMLWLNTHMVHEPKKREERCEKQNGHESITHYRCIYLHPLRHIEDPDVQY